MDVICILCLGSILSTERCSKLPLHAFGLDYHQTWHIDVPQMLYLDKKLPQCSSGHLWLACKTSYVSWVHHLFQDLVIFYLLVCCVHWIQFPAYTILSLCLWDQVIYIECYHCLVALFRGPNRFLYHCLMWFWSVVQYEWWSALMFDLSCWILNSHPHKL